MLIAGLVAPSGGDIWINGRLATYLPPNKRDIGIVFQNYALFPHLTSRENIAFPLRMRRFRRPRSAARSRRALESVQLPQVAAPTVRGIIRRPAATHRAGARMVYQPPVILMDEPLGALDRKLRDEMQLEIKACTAGSASPFVYVTHDQEEAMAMSDRIACSITGVSSRSARRTRLLRRRPSSPPTSSGSRTSWMRCSPAPAPRRC